MPSLTGIILTYNERQHVAACINALAWADDIVVFDSYSTDETPELAVSAGARVIQHPFEDYGAQRNAALQAASTDWVFFVDADERVSVELAAEIRVKIDGPKRGWWVPRHNYIFGILTLGAGWYPDYQLRVLHRQSARYNPLRPVHEEVLLTGETGYLEHALVHFNYRDMAQFIEKQERYTDIEAELRRSQAMRPRPRTFVTAPLREFYRRFIVLKGYQDGLHGLRLSMLMAYFEHVTWRKVARLWRSPANQENGSGSR